MVSDTRAGQVALVTGGSAGLGLAIATALADTGTAVVLTGRSADRCERAAAQVSAVTGRAAVGRACDVTDEAAVAGLAGWVLDRFGRLDVLVTSAGVQARGTIGELSVATLRACLEVNVVGTWLACRAAAEPMRAAGYGRIVTLASALGLVGAAARAGCFLDSEVPLRRWAAPDELASAALLLTDPSSAYLTGVILPVDGGWTAH